MRRKVRSDCCGAWEDGSVKSVGRSCSPGVKRQERVEEKMSQITGRYPGENKILGIEGMG